MTRWSARAALVALALAIPVALAAIPVHSTHGTIWPLAEHWGRAHAIAQAELLIGYVLLGLVLLAVGVLCTIRLFELAEWAK